MTSGVFMRINKPPKFELDRTFGYQRVSPDELHDIVKRLQNDTFNTKLYQGEKNQVLSYPPRAATVKCTKDNEGKRKKPPKGRPEHEVNRIFRRLQRTPTESILASRGKIKPQFELIAEINRDAERKKAVEHARDQKMKWLLRLRRPTSATRQRQFCWFCEDPKLSHYLEYDFSNDKTVSKEQLDNIIERMQTPTKASLGEEAPCPKRKDSLRRGAFSPDIPLVSGLERSKSVNEIVNRLYPGRPMSSPPTNAGYSERRKFRSNVTRPTSCVPTRTS